MLVRLALESDIDEIVNMGRMNAEETKQSDVFSENRAYEVCYQYLDTADPTIFVCEKFGKPLGFLIAGFGAYDHRDGFFTTQRVLYVKPENRGTRAAVLLIKELIAWSKRVGAAEVLGGNDNGFQSERTAGFLSHFGFEKVGYAMSLRLSETTTDRGRQG